MEYKDMSGEVVLKTKILGYSGALLLAPDFSTSSRCASEQGCPSVSDRKRPVF